MRKLSLLTWILGWFCFWDLFQPRFCVSGLFDLVALSVSYPTSIPMISEGPVLTGTVMTGAHSWARTLGQFRALTLHALKLKISSRSDPRTGRRSFFLWQALFFIVAFLSFAVLSWIFNWSSGQSAVPPSPRSLVDLDTYCRAREVDCPLSPCIDLAVVPGTGPVGTSLLTLAEARYGLRVASFADYAELYEFLATPGPACGDDSSGSSLVLPSFLQRLALSVRPRASRVGVAEAGSGHRPSELSAGSNASSPAWISAAVVLDEAVSSDATGAGWASAPRATVLLPNIFPTFSSASTPAAPLGLLLQQNSLTVTDHAYSTDATLGLQLQLTQLLREVQWSQAPGLAGAVSNVTYLPINLWPVLEDPRAVSASSPSEDVLGGIQYRSGSPYRSFSLMLQLLLLTGVIGLMFTLPKNREAGHRSLLLVHGCHQSAYLFSLLASTLFSMMVLYLVCLVIGAVGGLFWFSNPALVWIFLCLQTWTLLVFVAVLGQLIETERQAISILVTLFLVVMLVILYGPTFSVWLGNRWLVAALYMLLPVFSLNGVVDTLLLLEDSGYGARQATFFLRADGGSGQPVLSLSELVVALLGSSVGYTILVLLLESFGPYSAPRKSFRGLLWAVARFFRRLVCCGCPGYLRRDPSLSLLSRPDRVRDAATPSRDGALGDLSTDPLVPPVIQVSGLEHDYNRPGLLRRLMRCAVYGRGSSSDRGEALAGSSRALDGVSFAVHRNECLVMLGSNGSGKTTTLQCLIGTLFPQSGTVNLSVGDEARGSGAPGPGVTAGSSVAALGYVPQESNFPALWQTEEVLRLFCALRGLDLAPEVDRIVASLLRYFGLTTSSRSLAADLSGGIKRKLSLALALVGNPAVLVLDEPTAGMDIRGQGDMLRLLREVSRTSGRAVLMTTHYFNVAAALADRILIMNHGREGAYGTLPELMRQFNVGIMVTVQLSGRSVDGLAKRAGPDQLFSRLQACLPQLRQADQAFQPGRAGEAVLPTRSGTEDPEQVLSGEWPSASSSIVVGRPQLRVRLPSSARSQLPRLIDELISLRSEFPIGDVRIQTFDLEAVFLKSLLAEAD